MPTFQSKTFRSSAWENTIAAKYRRNLKRHPFALFGLPFILTMVAGAFFLTPAQALRYEKHDRKVRKMTQEEALGMQKDRRGVDINEEYYLGAKAGRAIARRKRESMGTIKVKPSIGTKCTIG
ncbi:Cytochrome oxidase assembly [Orbilia oligospora]|uniref:Cytochrome c oxidase assembly protein COX16, mitochondrial n=1 Tax=Orbilia oligospora TaxID=2813651 RepID=A0A7C8U659_ORBOL|nr:Cytochrome oxidase assembly [Orbilia oligospora]